MDCAEEVSLLRSRLSRVAGVRELRFDVVSGRLEVEYSPSQTSREAIERAVASTGMRCEPWRGEAGGQGAAAAWKRLLAWISGVALAAGLTVQVLLTGDAAGTLLAHGHIEGQDAGHATHGLALALFLIATGAGAAPVVPKALASLRGRRADMNLLVLVSLIGACWLAEWAEAATLSFLFALAGRLEQWSLGRARLAVAELVSGTPVRVTVVHPCPVRDGSENLEHEHLVEQASVGAGALVRVRPGERIAFDGVVTAGRSLVNQAFVTGESVPVEKTVGDPVYAGTLNLSGSIDLRTTAAAADTLLARTVRMAGESTTRRSSSERFVEQFARFYTPAVLVLAALVMILPPLWGQSSLHHAVYQGMVVLLVACPCALVISTPVSVAAGIAAAARRQVLIKGGSALEAAARVSVLALDKSAALTAGPPTLQRILPVGERTEPQILAALAAEERSSEHPIALAIREEARARGIQPAPAEGFWWSHSSRIPASLAGSDEARRQAAQLAADGCTVIACGQGHELWALIAFAQPLQQGLRSRMKALAELGIERFVLLSGDAAKAAQAAAQAAAIPEVFADLSPAEKTAQVAALAARHGVAFIGDSVHDAGALAAASVGIAMGPAAADVARENASVIMIPRDLARAAFLIRHARATLRVIQQNVWLAVSAKFLFLAAALTGSATLWMAIAADMGATLVVTLNGLRLLRPAPHPTEKC